MKKGAFREFLNTVHNRLVSLTSSKGEEYANSDDDQFANFRRNAAKLGIPKEAVLLVYLSKHMDAIEHWIKNINNNSALTRTAPSEPIEGRIDDAILYLVLLRAMVVEDRAIGADFSIKSDITATQTFVAPVGSKAVEAISSSAAGGVFKGHISERIAEKCVADAMNQAFEKTRNDAVTDAVGASRRRMMIDLICNGDTYTQIVAPGAHVKLRDRGVVVFDSRWGEKS